MNAEATKLVTFRLADDLFAADIFAVERVLRYQTPRALPDVPQWIEGVIEYQQRVIPVVNPVIEDLPMGLTVEAEALAVPGTDVMRLRLKAVRLSQAGPPEKREAFFSEFELFPLGEESIDARVVSMPCMELYDRQSAEYKESVLPGKVRARVAMEAGTSMPWYKYVGLDGAALCIDHYGASAPAGKLFESYGFTAANAVTAAKKILGK
jgi:hypothetical protein